MTEETTRAARPIDPFCATFDGTYIDDLVAVLRGPRKLPWRGEHMVRTEHFVVTHTPDRVEVNHGLSPAQIDDDLAGLLSEELFGPGWLRGPELFERIFTGVVRSMAEDANEAWRLFYANTLVRVDETLSGSAGPGRHGTVSDYAPVYARAEQELASGSVLELGACFGFLSLRLAAAGRRTTASDLSAGTMRLLTEVAPRLGISLDVMVSDAARVPKPDAFADNVLAVHLLEHLDADEGERVIAEALRLAARRVLIAVPLEAEADETWGHVRTISLADLESWGRASNHPFEVFEHHGGWLKIDV